MRRILPDSAPPWWATLGTLLLCGLFAAAGVWQLDRAREKETLLAAFDAGLGRPPVAAPADGADLARLRYRTIAAAGRYDAAHQVLLDARTRDGKAGYEVLTPLLRDGPAILVNRGWVPADPDRNHLPDMSVTTEPRRLTGLLDHLPRAAIAAGAQTSDEDGGWPRRMLFPTATEIGASLGYEVADYQLLLAGDAPDGYLREWRPAFMPPRQHVGYAVQWFAMALALVVIYATLNLRKARKAPSDS